MRIAQKGALGPSSQEHGLLGLALEVLSSRGKGSSCCAADGRSPSLLLRGLLSGGFEKVVQINVLSENKPQPPLRPRVWH